MRIEASALEQVLLKNLPRYYLLFGPEAFLVDESKQAIRQKIMAQLGIERMVVSADKSDLNSLIAQIAQPSLFAPIQLIELNFSKITSPQEAVLDQILQHASDNAYFLVQIPKLNQKQQTSKWFSTFMTQGLVISHWPLNNAAFARWISTRAQKNGVTLSEQHKNLLLYATEGNCLAAAQEIERLSLYPEAEDAVQNSQFQAFDLSDAVFQKRTEQTLKILNYIQKTEEIPLLLVIWTLTQRLNAQPSAAYQALARLADADIALKSGENAQAFRIIVETCLQLCGHSLFPPNNFEYLPL